MPRSSKQDPCNSASDHGALMHECLDVVSGFKV